VRLSFKRGGEGADGAVGQPVDRDVPEQSDRGLRVLVIDDDKDVREFIATSLEEYGHHAIQCGDAADGIVQFARLRPDLVIIDYIMPGMTGAEVAQQIRADSPAQPILFVSGYSETDAIRAVAPDAPLLAKPFRPAALDEAVRTIMATQITL